MIPTIIIDKASDQRRHLENQLKRLCPCLKLLTIIDEEDESWRWFQTEEKNVIVFWNPEAVTIGHSYNFHLLHPNTVLICVAKSYEYTETAIKYRAAGYLLTPVQEKKLLTAVDTARMLIQEKIAQQQREQLLAKLFGQKREERLIGIPSIGGIEILLIDDIIRCEGLQKCTRIITGTKKDIISAYNIGEFRKLLCPFGGFYSPHRSHVINLVFVSKYQKSGIIVMKDGSEVPITNQNKATFLQHITSL